MRFILNFFFFGLLFYLIYLFFPEAFNTLVGWANNAYHYLRDLVNHISGKGSPARPGNPDVPQSLLIPFLSFAAYMKRFF